MLASALLGMVAGSRSLREVEQLTAELTPALRTKLGIPRRVPDTTLRDALSSLEPDGLPFGVVSLDGKATRVPAADDFFAHVRRRRPKRACSAWSGPSRPR